MALDGELQVMLPNLLTKADSEALSDRLGRVFREEIAQLWADLASMEARLTTNESDSKALRTDIDAVQQTVAGCESSLAHLTTCVASCCNMSPQTEPPGHGGEGEVPNRKHTRASTFDFCPYVGWPTATKAGSSQGTPCAAPTTSQR
ncbi:Hypothetical predicted protein [Pelobates cultripes]|uniref:Uncharacterized protein n=1 Tax=Pelobates cultripes TaxID=61616 RepID=A0AAD1SL97_PELCU|nr:Hypothetical predicted protein [Pelobates cultripes]